MSRGLVGDIDVLEARLKVVSYFHLSGYMRFFRDAQTQRFRAGTSVDDVWSLYRFDRRLRLILLDAIEKIEQAVKSALLNEFGARQSGAFDYLESAHFPRIDKKFHADLAQYLTLPPGSPSEKIKSRHRRLLGIPFVREFVSKYQECRLPFWMAVEVLSFGQLVRLVTGTSTAISKSIAAELTGGMYEARVLESWLLCLVDLRNVCAHQQRLWNWSFARRPQIPRRSNCPAWRAFEADRRAGGKRSNGSLFLIHTMSELLRVIAPGHRLKVEVGELLGRYPSVDTQRMGAVPGVLPESVEVDRKEN